MERTLRKKANLFADRFAEPTMKVILSRKGFDSAYGDYPGPIPPGEEMVSLLDRGQERAVLPIAAQATCPSALQAGRRRGAAAWNAVLIDQMLLILCQFWLALRNAMVWPYKNNRSIARAPVWSQKIPPGAPRLFPSPRFSDPPGKSDALQLFLCGPLTGSKPPAILQKIEKQEWH